MAWGPRARAAVSIHIALVARVDTPAAALTDIHAAVLVEIFAVVPIDSAAALRDDSTFAANGFVLDAGGAAQCSDCDDPERDTAQSPRSALG